MARSEGCHLCQCRNPTDPQRPNSRAHWHLCWVHQSSHGLQKTKNPGAGTVAGYIKAAALWLETEFCQTINTCSLTSPGTSTVLHPPLSNLIATQQTCGNRRKRRNPSLLPISNFCTKVSQLPQCTTYKHCLVMLPQSLTGPALACTLALNSLNMDRANPKGSAFAPVPQGSCAPSWRALCPFYDAPMHLAFHPAIPSACLAASTLAPFVFSLATTSSKSCKLLA
jgi:hypothetical protein